MPRHAAIRFEHRSSLVDYVRQYGGADTDQRHTLYACHGDDPGLPQTLYFLARPGERRWPTKSQLQRGWEKVQIDVDYGAGTLTERGAETVERKLISWKADASLPVMLGPSEVNEEGEPPDVVVIWCKGEPVFQKLVGMSLSLGCDRLQYAVLSQEEGDAPAEILLRAERVSYYAIESAVESADAQVYIPLGRGGLYVNQGATHPLIDLLDDAGRSGHVLFMDGLGVSATTRRVDLPSWKDVYRLTSFELEGMKGDEQWKESETSASTFVVKLRLAASHALREPQLWLLHEDEQPHIERLLRAIPEADLDNLQFTAQETPKGDRYLIVRERHTGIGREYIDFEGIQLSPYAGHPNLMLPIDKELEPQLRKDRYRNLFGLKPGYLTLMWESKGKPRLVHFSERSFQPLREFIDYIVGIEGKELNRILGSATFDFQDYRFAAPTPGRDKPRKARKKANKADDTNVEWVAEIEDDTVEVVVQRERTDEPTAVKKPRKAAPKKTPSELEASEIQIESDIILKGQDGARWTELARTKAALGKHREAALCWLEALWLLPEGDKATEATEDLLLAALESSPDINLSGATAKGRAKRLKDAIARSDCDPAFIWLYITYGARHLSKNPGDSNARAWLTESHKLLEARKDALRKKDRWMLWSRVIRVNSDTVEASRVREDLLDELNNRGLRPVDVPEFIQNRIYQSRLIDDGGVTGGAEARAAMRILERIQLELQNAQDESVRIISSAIMAYGFERLGDPARASQHFQAAEQSFNNRSGLTGLERAWVALYLGAARELTEEGGGQEWLDRFDRLFRQHKTGDLYSSELATIQEHILDRAGSDSPSQFLDAENFRSLFPSSQKYTRSQAIRQEVEGMVQRGEFEATLRTLQGLSEQAAKGSLGVDPRELAWLLQSVVVKSMRRIGRASEGVGILDNFEKGRKDPNEDIMGGFYPTLYMLVLGEGFLDLGEERRGMDLVCGAIRGAWTGENTLQWLDHLDMLSMALNAIEMAPMEHRLDAVNEVLEALYLDRAHPGGSDRPQYRPIKLRLLDHCMEVSLSKEKLSLKRYKNYLEEDEFHVRQRIIKERLT